MTDIVKHLRLNAEDFRYDNADEYASHGALMLSAADEIERLRNRLLPLEADLVDMGERNQSLINDLAEAEALLRDLRPPAINPEWWGRRNAFLARRKAD